MCSLLKREIYREVFGNSVCHPLVIESARFANRASGGNVQESKYLSRDVMTLFDEIGGDPLAGSGFETEEAEWDFNESSQFERGTRASERSKR